MLAEIQELMEQHGDVYWEPELLGLSGWLAAAGPFCKHLIGRVDQESLRLRVAFCASPCAWKLLLTYAVPFIVATLGRSGRVGARARKLTARLG